MLSWYTIFLRKGDFNYLELLYEDIICNKPIDIGDILSLKNMPNETFSYFIAKTDTNSTLYQDRIILLRKKETEQYLKRKIDEKYFFRLSIIVLSE